MTTRTFSKVFFSKFSSFKFLRNVKFIKNYRWFAIDAEMAKRDPENEHTIAIVGAGAAGLACAETLRQEGNLAIPKISKPNSSFVSKNHLGIRLHREGGADFW